MSTEEKEVVTATFKNEKTGVVHRFEMSNLKDEKGRDGVKVTFTPFLEGERKEEEMNLEDDMAFLFDTALENRTSLILSRTLSEMSSEKTEKE